MNMVLLGPPGAGKGTQAVRLARGMGLRHLSSGDILRAERRAKTELGRQAHEYMDRGALVPDDLILAMMMDHITRPGSDRGCLLDGFPRTVVQARGLDRRLAERGQKLDVVVNIEVDDGEVTARMTGRLSCPECGKIYHEEFSPPRCAGYCDDHVTAALVRRADDHPEVVQERLRTYHEETKPLVSYYAAQGNLRPVDGCGTVDEVAQRIQEACQV